MKRQRKITNRNLKGDTNYFCMSDHLADVWFAFKGDSTKLPAHRLLLSMRSEVFEAMFYGPLAETSDTIILEDIDIFTMKMLLCYIYSDDIELDGWNVTSCLYAAKKYALYDMADKCSTFLETAVGVDTACTIYEQAKIYGDVRLATKCIDFICCRSNDVFVSKDFHNLSSESVLEITRNENLSSEEHFVFAAIKGWGESECKRKGLEPSSENLRACLGDIIFMIRFPLMPIDVFAKEVVPTGILTNEETLMLYNYLAIKIDGQEVEKVGRFSCSNRNIIMRLDRINSNPDIQECAIVLNTSKSVRVVAIHGDFVHQVEQVAFNWSSSEVTFDKQGEKLLLREPLVISPQFGNAKLSFRMKVVNGLNPDKTRWSVKVNSIFATKNYTVHVRFMPCTLHALVLKKT